MPNFGNNLTGFIQSIQERNAQKRKLSDPRYAAAEMAMTKPVARPNELQRPTEGLPEFQALKSLAKQRIEGQYGAAGREQDISRRRAFSKLGGGAGIEQRVGAEQGTELQRSKAGATTEAMNQLDVAQEQEKERRYEFDVGTAEQKFQFDANLAFQQTGLGQQLLQGWKQLDQQDQVNVTNAILGIEAGGISAKDIANMTDLMSYIFPDASLPPTDNGIYLGNRSMGIT